MRSVGQVLKDARSRKKLSREGLGDKTKIKKDYIEAIENEEWQALPEYPVVQGFVRSIAGALKLDKEKTIALLRRDYPPRSLRVNPKPDVSDKFTWTPRLTFIAGAVGVVALALFYLFFQYLRFVSPPNLEVYYPEEGMIVEERLLSVSGKTDTDSVVKINNQPAVIDADGKFTAEIEIYEGTDEIEVRAESRGGKVTIIKRKIIPRLE